MTFVISSSMKDYERKHCYGLASAERIEPYVFPNPADARPIVEYLTRRGRSSRVVEASSQQLEEQQRAVIRSAARSKRWYGRE